MEIYLIRHTTPKIEKGICYGQTDLDVTESFKSEANTIKLELGKLDNDIKIYSSPLLRCLKLAKEISNSQPTIDKRLMELNFGDWEMQAWNDINQKELAHWMDDFVNVSCPNGESYKSLHTRTSEFINELQQQEYKKVLIVTHGGVIRSMLSYIKQAPLIKSFDTKVNYGDVFKVVI